MAVAQKKDDGQRTLLVKVARVIELFDREDADPKAIAKKLGFDSHREMGQFMKLHGFIWSTDQGNYVPEHEERSTNEAWVEITGEDANSMGNVTGNGERLDGTLNIHPAAVTMDAYLPLLQYLAVHHKRLQALIEGHDAPSPGAIPRYTIPGVLVTKSVHMVRELDLLVRSFSQERNITQREIFEVALIEFFRRYGYAQEVQRLLSGA